MLLVAADLPWRSRSTVHHHWVHVLSRSRNGACQGAIQRFATVYAGYRRRARYAGERGLGLGVGVTVYELYGWFSYTEYALSHISLYR